MKPAIIGDRSQVIGSARIHLRGTRSQQVGTPIHQRPDAQQPVSESLPAWGPAPCRPYGRIFFTSDAS